MPRYQPVQILGGCYSDEDRSFSLQDTVNWLPEQAEQAETRTPSQFKTPPGLRPFLEIPGTVVPPSEGNPGYTIPSKPVRATYNCEGKLFTVIGKTLYQVTNQGVAIPQGTIPGNGRVVMAHNQISQGNELVAVNGSSGYVYNTLTQVFAKITDEGFPGAIWVGFADGYIIGVEPGRRFAFNSDPADAMNYNTLDRFTSEYKPDLIVTGVVNNNELILLNETSYEFFENTGATQQPFRSKRIYGDVGCASRYGAGNLDRTVFMFGADGKFYRLEGYSWQRISTRPIEQAIRGLNWSQAFFFAWEDSGHSVAYWTFPDGLTWGFDQSTNLWHRRKSYGLDRWRVNTSTQLGQDWYMGDFQSGRIWVMDWDYILEGDECIERKRVTGVLSDNQNLIEVNRFEPIFNTGQVLTVPVEFPAQPEGPTLSGALPDGSVSIPWAGGTYTAVGGTPPYTFTSRPGTSFPGDLGPMNALGVVAAEVPDEPGTGINIVRVTDANGLFDELTDEFLIGNIVALLGDSSSTLRPYILFGPGGTDWDNAYQYNGLSPLLGSVGLLGGGGKWVTWDGGGVSSPRYSTDNTATAWVTSAAAFDAGTKVPYGVYSNGVFLIPANDGIYRSTDDFVSMTKITTTSGAYSIDCSDNLAMSIRGPSPDVWTSPTPYTTWTIGGAHGVTLSSGSRITFGGGRFLIGGSTVGGFPMLKFTVNGTSFSTETLPTLAAGYINAAAYHDGVWAVGTSGGELIYMNEDDGIWNLSPDSFGSTRDVRDMEHNGVCWIAIGKLNTGGSASGMIKTSLNGINWTTAPTLEPVTCAALAVMK